MDLNSCWLRGSINSSKFEVKSPADCTHVRSYTDLQQPCIEGDATHKAIERFSEI